MLESSDSKINPKFTSKQEWYEGTKEPLFIEQSSKGKVHDGEPIAERNSILAIVRDPKTDRYLGLKWKQIDWETVITGGIEEGQDAETAARAEIQEETGYGNLTLVKQLTNIHSLFYHGPKKQNRLAHFTVLYFELSDDAHTELSTDEQAMHDVVWLTKDDMESFRLPDAHRYSWNELMRG